ncbi:hypothetical protein CAPTEDRAFT_217787 [Capitella teleta]|uniref:Uncharacterized protein n=1 Tax=Capitella teleta TaxID=283909 RepID=R7VD35_CAPTE|nr:hypothetical protein CAPTEDRAFT_217787 [Capitella teleta]|eukprot:ELU16487.1 hypothetical protein CAPTEDRAFT_217787 [Capitella teleta]
MDQDQFTNAMLIAFNNDMVKKSLVELVSQALTDPVSDRVTESLRNEVVMLRAELRELDQRIYQLEEKLQSAESDTDSLEQYTRRNSLRIAGIREETGEDPTEKVMELVNSTLKLNPPLDITEVDRIHRVGKPASATNQRNNPRAILVKLATYRSRKRIMDLRPQTKTLPDVFLNEGPASSNENATRRVPE